MTYDPEHPIPHRRWDPMPDDAGFWVVDFRGTHEHRILRVGIMGDQLVCWIPRRWVVGDEEDSRGEVMISTEHPCMKGSWWSKIEIPWGLDRSGGIVMRDPYLDGGEVPLG